MRINTNVSSLNAQRNLWHTQGMVSSSMQKLSSGFRINRAGDDAAGLGIANSLRAGLRSLRQAARNAEQATAMLQIADGATQTISGILDRMKELATQAASDNTDSAGRTRIKSEWDSLVTEVGKIASTTKFQQTGLIGGTFGNAVDTNVANSTGLADASVIYSASISGTSAGTYTVSNPAAGTLRITDGTVTQDVTLTASGKQSVTFDQFGITLDLEVGYDNTVNTNTVGDIVVTAGSGGEFLVRSSGAYTTDDVIGVNSLNLTAATLGIDAASISLTGSGTRDEWQTALTGLDSAIGVVNTALGTIGAAQNRIDFATQNTKTAIENVSAAESTIRDVDMAEEMANFSKSQILAQAGTAMLAQANQMGQGVLQLLRN